jgi:integrase
MNKMEIKETIMKNRPTLKENTVKSYVSLLYSLYQQVFPDDKEIVLSKFDDSKKFLDYLMEHYDPSVRKTYLSNLVVLTENEDYRTQMMLDVEETKKIKSDNVMNEKQILNHITNSEVKYLIQTLKNETKLIYKTKSFTPANLLKIQNMILITLFSGIYIPPRRLLDWAYFKVKNIDDKIDNFLDGDNIVYNTYKTAFSYGQQRVKIPKPLLKIIQKYISVIPESQEYMFVTITGKQMNSTLLNQRMNDIWGGRKISCNEFRHLYLSTHYGNHITLKKDLADMGTSMNVLDTYIQRGDFK